jgi:hypothetical protein
MIDIKLFRSTTVSDLYASVDKNLKSYRAGNFDHLLADTSLFIDSSCKLDPIEKLNLTCSKENINEVDCCLAIINGLKGVSSYLARDERLWVRLTHLEFLNYSRIRWAIPEDDVKAIHHIQTHFFAKGARGIERNNAISRLWWMAKICEKVNGLSLQEALTACLYQSDVRASIVERPTTSQNPELLSAIVNKLYQSYLNDKSLYEREKFRSLMKQLNLEGGVRLFEVLDKHELEDIVSKASQ